MAAGGGLSQADGVDNTLLNVSWRVYAEVPRDASMVDEHKGFDNSPTERLRVGNDDGGGRRHRVPRSLGGGKPAGGAADGELHVDDGLGL